MSISMRTRRYGNHIQVGMTVVEDRIDVGLLDMEELKRLLSELESCVDDVSSCISLLSKEPT